MKNISNRWKDFNVTNHVYKCKYNSKILKEEDDDNKEYYHSVTVLEDNEENMVLNDNNSTNNANNIIEYDSNSTIIRRLLDNSFSEDKNKYINVLDDPSENIIKVINFDKDININSSCPIYQHEFEENEEIGILPCKHCFNYEAIKKWLNERKAECPVCRESFASKEILDKNDDEIINNNSEIEPLLSENNFRNRDIGLTIRNMLDVIYMRQEERELQRVLMNSVNSEIIIDNSNLDQN